MRSFAASSSDLVPLEELLADNHALDLRGSLADQQQRRVAVEALDLVLLRVAVAAVDAEAFLDAVLAALRGEELGHPGLEVGALAGVLHPRRFAGDQAGSLDLVAMSASLNWIAWWLEIVLPKVFRSWL